jgi:hypothetical protein
MGNPVTMEKCDLCGKEFDIPMVKSRRGWNEGYASLSLEYDRNVVDDCYADPCCPVCADKIADAVLQVIAEIKYGAGKK